jgi:hypothetical protein
VATVKPTRAIVRSLLAFALPILLVLVALFNAGAWGSR